MSGSLAQVLKHIFRCIVCFFSVSAGHLLATDSRPTETLRVLTWEGYAPIQMRERFRQYIKGKYKINLKFDVRYVSHADEYFDSIRKKSRRCHRS